MPSSKTTITEQEYQQLLGLMLLAQQHNKSLIAIERAALLLVGETEDDGSPMEFGRGGHAVDQIYSSNPDVDELLRKLRLSVSKEG